MAPTPYPDALDDTAWMTSEERAIFERARALVPALATTERAAREAREVPAAHVQAMREAGLTRVLQPRRFGGLQRDTRLFSRIVEELAHGCASSAWVYAVLGEHQWVIACFPEEAQIDVWGENPMATASSSLVPRGTLSRVDGGYRLSGRYPFSSGCGHAQWVLLGAFEPGATGTRSQRYSLIPMREVTVIDDWHVLGLEGTGSRSVQVDDVFIPAHRTVTLAELDSGSTPGARAHPDYPMLRAPRSMFAHYSQPPVALTLARRLLAYVTEMCKTRVSRAVNRTAESETTHLKLAASSAEIETAVRLLHWGRERSVALLYGGAPISAAERLGARRDVVFTQRLVRQATERLSELAGASYVYDASPMQPLLRDIQTCLTHGIANYEGGMVPYGRAMLGLDAAPAV